MTYIPGEHLVVCAKCRKRIFRSEAIRSDVTGLLYCKEGGGGGTNGTSSVAGAGGKGGPGFIIVSYW